MKGCLKKYTIKDALRNISISWNDMSQNTLARSWNKLLPSQGNNNFTLDLTDVHILFIVEQTCFCYLIQFL